jgi:hypothetical protein
VRGVPDGRDDQAFQRRHSACHSRPDGDRHAAIADTNGDGHASHAYADYGGTRDAHRDTDLPGRDAGKKLGGAELADARGDMDMGDTESRAVTRCGRYFLPSMSLMRSR